MKRFFVYIITLSLSLILIYFLILRIRGDQITLVFTILKTIAQRSSILHQKRLKIYHYRNSVTEGPWLYA